MKRKHITIILFFIASLAGAQNRDSEWPLYSGKSDLAGVTLNDISYQPGLIWSIATNARTKSSPVVSEGIIYFGNEKGTLLAVSRDGIIKWKFEAGSAIDAAPAVVDKLVVFGTADGKLMAVEKGSGKLAWSYATENQIAGSANSWSAGKKRGIVVGSYDYFLHCVDPETGKLLWKTETDNYVNGTPAILNGRIVFGGCDGLIRVVDPVTGIQRDPVEIGVYIAGSPALSGNMAYFGDYEGTVYGIDISAGKTVWNVPGGDSGGSILATPAANAVNVVVGSEDKNLYCFNATDGSLKWKFRTNGKITGSAVIAGSGILFGSGDGNVYLINPDGQKKWNFNVGSPVGSSPAVVKGRFYVLTEDGRLFCFGDKK